VTLPAILKGCDIRKPASESAVRNAEEQLGRPLPEDYKGVLRESDGCEGFISEHSYVLLWSTTELANLNDAYRVSEFLPGVTLVGTDGGDTGYGFRGELERLEYVAVPLVGMEPNVVSVIGRSFVELVERLAQRD
jgi:hypothetical protein